MLRRDSARAEISQDSHPASVRPEQPVEGLRESYSAPRQFERRCPLEENYMSLEKPIIPTFSLAERDRRWKLLRQEMRGRSTRAHQLAQ